MAVDAIPTDEPVIHLGWRLPTKTIRTVVESYGHSAHGGNLDDTVSAWAEAGFDGHEVDGWLRAGCFSPSAARDLADAGLDARAAREMVGVE